VDPNLDSVKKVHSINECESRNGFGESCFTCDMSSAMSANDYTLCLKKTTVTLHTITSMHINQLR